ncbi:hypothetical protein OAS43_01645 [Candidatus Pelagibacter sp.]|nr:hypothetical protein [Candidatus Pelagibacter sp.]
MMYLYFYLISFSIIGYGFLISNLLTIDKKNFGFLGIAGIIFVSSFSYLTTLFFKHDYFFNSCFFILGFIIFLISLKNFKSLKKELLSFFVIFTILLLFITVAKNHDDFPYYHFPYMVLLTEYPHPIGLGLLNNGFRSPSSIFFIGSMLYLPGIKFYLFHLIPALILGFSNLMLFNLIIDKKIFDKNKFINLISLLSLIFINIFFYRLAEHGTDRSGMIVVILSLIYLLYITNNTEKNQIDENINLIKIFSVFICFASTIKPSFIINFPFFLILLMFNHTRSLFLSLIFSRTFFYCIIIIFLSILFTFLNSSCLIFPISFTCFENLPWSIEKNAINDVKIWFELWSKGGANPHYVVDNRLDYISGINWFENWINIYFFNKVSDFILGILILSLIFYLTFYSKKRVKLKKNKIFLIYLFIIILLIEWFFNHPTLRYGGYHIIALLFFIPLCLIVEKMDIKFEVFIKKAFLLFFITLLLFTVRNVSRLNDEYKKYNYNPFNDSKFKFIGGNEGFYLRYNKHIENHNKTYKFINLLGKELILFKR